MDRAVTRYISYGKELLKLQCYEKVLAQYSSMYAATPGFNHHENKIRRNLCLHFFVGIHTLHTEQEYLELSGSSHQMKQITTTQMPNDSIKQRSM